MFLCPLSSVVVSKTSRSTSSRMAASLFLVAGTRRLAWRTYGGSTAVLRGRITDRDVARTAPADDATFVDPGGGRCSVWRRIGIHSPELVAALFDDAFRECADGVLQGSPTRRQVREGGGRCVCRAWTASGAPRRLRFSWLPALPLGSRQVFRGRMVSDPIGLGFRWSLPRERRRRLRWVSAGARF